ncbi:MAG: glycosyltransferase [Bacteroidota bacterium]
MVIEKKVKYHNENLKYSIIIPSWNNVEYLKLCINSIRKNSRFKHQIIVHVNEGNDGTVEWLDEQADVDYTHSKENIGICYALNFASSIVKTNYIVYMNDDMYVCPDWDKYLDDEIKSIGHNMFFLSSTMIEPETNNSSAIECDCGSDIDVFDEEKLLEEYSRINKEDWSGATWPPNIVHKDIWNLVGGYSIEFTPGMYSDPDFSMKLWRMGVRLFKGVGKSRVYHFAAKTTKRISKTKSDGYNKFFDKWRMSAKTFTDEYLLRGKPYKGILSEPTLKLSTKIKNRVKKYI